jgi:hypothetical protein
MDELRAAKIKLGRDALVPSKAAHELIHRKDVKACSSGMVIATTSSTFRQHIQEFSR